MSKKNSFEDDFDLVTAHYHVGHLWGRKDNLRVTRIKGTKTYEAFRVLMDAQDAAFRAWVSEFGTPKQQKDLLNSDEAKRFLEDLDAGKIKLPARKPDGRTVEGRKLRAAQVSP